MTKIFPCPTEYFEPLLLLIEKSSSRGKSLRQMLPSREKQKESARSTEQQAFYFQGAPGESGQVSAEWTAEAEMGAAEMLSQQPLTENSQRIPTDSERKPQRIMTKGFQPASKTKNPSSLPVKIISCCMVCWGFFPLTFPLL